MSLYVDASALVKRYVDEPSRRECLEILGSDPVWVSARHTFVEVSRGLARAHAVQDRAHAERLFRGDWVAIAVVELDESVCGAAADFAVTLGVRTLDALHLAAAERVGGGALPFLTYDRRLAQAARSLGWAVLGT